MSPKIAISEREYAIHRLVPFLRPAVRSRYPKDLNTGRPLKEFVALADACRRLGLEVIPMGAVEQVLKAGEPVVKFGRTDIHADIELLADSRNGQSEWNSDNLEKVLAWNDCLDLGRRTWSLWLDVADHMELLRGLFEARGRLFIKTAAKGYAGICSDFRAFREIFPDTSRLCEESRSLIVSEVLEIGEIQAERYGKRENMTDEWRHYVYAGRLVSTIHAFDCNPARTDASGYGINREKAENTVRELEEAGFATSYVLDTCTLANGGVVVVEVNNLFASGIYGRGTVKLLARAIASG